MMDIEVRLRKLEAQYRSALSSTIAARIGDLEALDDVAV
jgi:hypothetical protein